jgi:hypothetical protein
MYSISLRRPSMTTPSTPSFCARVAMIPPKHALKRPDGCDRKRIVPGRTVSTFFVKPKLRVDTQCPVIRGAVVSSLRTNYSR